MIKILGQSKQLIALYTKIRDVKTTRAEFVFFSDRIIRLLIEEALNMLPFKEIEIVTPTGSAFTGYDFVEQLCCVSILRGGESMEFGFRNVIPGVVLGKILIQRNEDTALPKLYFTKLPIDIRNRYVMLLDPMLATGGSVSLCIESLLKPPYNVQPDRIIFVNLIAAPEGLTHLTSKYPQIRIITGCIDKQLNEKKYIIPGLGDFGDRYFGTPDVSAKL